MPQSKKSQRHVHFIDDKWMTDEEYIEYANTVSFYEREDEGSDPFGSVEEARLYFMNNASLEGESVYNLNGSMYNENEIIHLAQELSSELSEGESFEINDINDALRLFSENDIQVNQSVMFKDGGTVENITSPRQYFASLDLSILPEDAQTLIKEDILAGDEIDALEASDEDFLEARRKIDAIINAGTTPAPSGTENATVVKLNAEINDLTELMEMEDDQAIITKLKQEIQDLQELIELEA